MKMRSKLTRTNGKYRKTFHLTRQFLKATKRFQVYTEPHDWYEKYMDSLLMPLRTSPAF